MAYTFWSVVFGEQPSASKWNILGTNDAGFKDGTNFDNDLIKSKHIDWSATGGGDTGGIWWEELGRTVLGSNATAITVSFTAKRFLRIITYVTPASATSLVMTFNNDTANNYAYGRSNNGGTDANTVSNGNTLIGRGSTWTTKQMTDMFISNPNGELKLWHSHSVNEEGAGAGNAPSGTEQRGKYVSNTQVSRVDITGSSNALGTGSMMLVLGHD